MVCRVEGGEASLTVAVVIEGRIENDRAVIDSVREVSVALAGALEIELAHTVTDVGPIETLSDPVTSYGTLK